MHRRPLTLAPRSCAAGALGLWGLVKLAGSLQARASPEERLLAAAKQGSVTEVMRALAAGAAVDSRDPATRETALMKAAAGLRPGHADVLQVLLAAGAVPDYTDAGGNAALHAAAASGSAAHVLALVEAGAAVDRMNAERATPLMLAFQQGRDEAVLALLSHGADPSPLQSSSRGRSWTAFCRADAAAVRRAELAFQRRLERQWQLSAASSSRRTDGASSSGSGASGSGSSSSAVAPWPAGPQEPGGRMMWCPWPAFGSVLRGCRGRVPPRLPV